MTLRPNVILAPPLVSVKIAVNPVLNMISSMNLIAFRDYNYGIDDWVLRTAKGMHPQLLHRHELVFGGLVGITGVMTEAQAPSVEALIDWLEGVDPVDL